MEAPPDPPSEEPQGITIDQLLDHITPRAWVTPLLAALIVAGFAVEIALGVSFGSPTAEQLLEAGADFGPAVVDGAWWRPLTSMFLHAGPLHLVFNLWAFYSVGKLTERIFGNIAFLAIYLCSGIGGALASLAWNPLQVSVGASGAIFGVYGALLAFAALHRGVFPPEYLAQQRNSIIAFLGYNVLFGLSRKETDMAAHVGGFMVGMAAGALLSRDVLAPAARRGARLAGGAGLALSLVIAAVSVRARIAATPEVKAERAADEGMAYLTADRFPEALEAFTQALAYKRVPAWLNARGYVYLRDGKLELAEKDLQEAKASKETSSTSQFLCEVYVRRGIPENRDATIRECSEAIDQAETPQEKAFLFAMRGSAQRSINENAALADADDALKLNPNEHRALSLRADLRRARGENDLAELDCSLLLTDPTAEDLAVCAKVSEALHGR